MGRGAVMLRAHSSVVKCAELRTSVSGEWALEYVSADSSHAASHCRGDLQVSVDVADAIAVSVRAFGPS
jgi:hypothetical protein